jgi:hypothetical protein
MTQIERGSYSYRGWLIVSNGKMWLMWPPGAPDGTVYTKAVGTLREAKAFINVQQEDGA